MTTTSYAEMLGGPLDGAYRIEMDDDAGTMVGDAVDQIPAGTVVELYRWQTEPERAYVYDGVTIT